MDARRNSYPDKIMTFYVQKKQTQRKGEWNFLSEDGKMRNTFHTKMRNTFLGKAVDVWFKMSYEESVIFEKHGLQIHEHL